MSIKEDCSCMPRIDDGQVTIRNCMYEREVWGLREAVKIVRSEVDNLPPRFFEHYHRRIDSLEDENEFLKKRIEKLKKRSRFVIWFRRGK